MRTAVLQAAKSAVAPTPGAGGKTAMEQFGDWTTRYLAADSAQKVALVKEGEGLAKARRPQFRQLIQSDPRRAIEEAVPMLVRQKMPVEVVSQLEERVADRAELRVYAASPDSAQRGEAPYWRYVETRGGKTYEAHVYGRREQQILTYPEVSINGVALDGDLALNESPIRRLEVGEIPDPGKKSVEICPVSGKTTEVENGPAGPQAVSATATAIEVYQEVVYLCDGAHYGPYEQILIMAEAGSGGPQSFTGAMPAAAVPAVGVLKVLYVPAIFADQGQSPASEALCHDVLKQVADFYQVQSYGRLTMVSTVTPPVKLPRSQAWYKGKDTTDGYVKEIDGAGWELTHAKEAARALGYDWQDYHCFVVRANGGARYPTSFGGGGNVWMRNDNVSTVAHEVGHAFSLAHANFWLTNGASVIGPGGNEEYGDIYDNMGFGSPPAGHYNVQAKNQVRWMPNEFAPPITQSGQYRIHAFDTPRLEQGKMYALRIVKDAERTYWGSYRSLYPSNPWVTNGLILGWNWPLNSGSNIHLLDTTPGSINGKNDAALAIGSTFSDTEHGIHLTTVAVNPTTSPPSVDVQVNFGDFSDNRPPVLDLTPVTSVVPLNYPVSFTATASDPDGDALVYSWRWHDTFVSPNSATVTRSFLTNGVYAVSCVVSDMKGGTAVRNAVVTVGNGNGRFTISGRIMTDGMGLRGVNVSTGGANGTLTDSDGQYVISNLAPGTYTVTPAEHGLQFNELFNNSITVGPSFAGADFTTEALPVVTLTAQTPEATEDGIAGGFRLSRTGSTSLPLTVRTLVVRGTAAKTADYTFSPDYEQLSGTAYYTFTIPEDQASLDIAVTAVNDALAEGDENVQLILGLDTGYLNDTPATATVVIRDNDTALPRVSLTASQAQIMENSGQSITCTFRRTGVTTSALSVPYTLAATNSATNGTDFVTLSGTAIIPIGSDSVAMLVTPIDDSQAEASETVAINISTGAVLVADAGASTVSLKIVDDDTQVVSLTPADAAATEVDRGAVGAVPDPGTFLVSRTGDSSRALTVFYSAAGSALHGVDYEALAGSIVLPAGETKGVITIMPRLDGFGEGPESVLLSLAAGNDGYILGSVSAGTVTIADNPADKPLLEVMVSSTVAQEPATNGAFRITAKGAGTGTFTVNYTISGTATAGADYTALSGSTTMTLNNGTVTKDIPVAVLNDTDLEEMETLILTLTPSADYALWEHSQTATMLLRDDDQPTVFVDPQIGTTTDFNHSIPENRTTIGCKFWISRTGATASALTVNYALVGTATNGNDHTSLSGTAVIPVGAPGLDVPFTINSDSLFEGTETVTVRLSPGAYARGPDATIYILDDDAGDQSVGFANSGGSGSESVTSVSIPVRLSSPATTPVSVEYALDTGTRTPTGLYGLWVRLVRTGTAYTTFTSRDGTSFTQTSSGTFPQLPSGSYLAGIAVTSGSANTLANIRIDNFSVTGLSGGGSMGTLTKGDIAGTLPMGSQVETGTVYNLTAGGPDIGQTAIDGGRIVYFPITNSLNCTITARVVDMTCTSSNVRAGVTVRESLAAGSRHVTYLVDSAGATRRNYRMTADTNATSGYFAAPTFSKPQWLRLQRVGNTYRAFTSTDGATFTALGTPVALDLSTQQSLVGLAVSSRSDGLLTQGVFDNVTLSTGGTLQGRSIGFVNEAGSASYDNGTYRVNGSGVGVMPFFNSTEDECYFIAAPTTGDFTLTARVASITGGSTVAQAGLMVRESGNYRGRTVWLGLSGLGSATSVADFRARISAPSSGEGLGIDYSLAPGLLNFAVGEQTKNILLNVTNDILPEPVEFVTLALKFPTAAVLGALNTYTYAIIDDEVSTTLPVIGFGGPASTGPETNSPAVIPVVLSEASQSSITVDYTTTATGTATGGGVDFGSVSGTLTFAPGETYKPISLPIINDALVETDETVVLTLAGAANAVMSTTSTHTFSIQDDDIPSVTITASDPNAEEGGSSGAFTFSRTGDTAADLTVNFTRAGTAISGDDYTAFTPATSVTIPAGQTSLDLLVVPLQNTTPEGLETVIVALATGSGYVVATPSAATVTISDDDVNTLTITASDPMASEVGGNAGEFTITRSGPTTAGVNFTLTISGTAAPVSDYAALTTNRTFTVGQSVMTIPVTVASDTLTEGDEVVVISINANAAYILGTPSAANVTIIDDDLPPSVFISSPVSKSSIIDAGNGLMLEATAMDDGLPNALTYTWSQIFGPGIITFATPTAAATTATFSAAGVYGLRVSVTDGQFSATDDLIVQSGGFSYAKWVSVDQGPPNVRGIGGESDGAFTLIGSGVGYSSANDAGHMLFRQLLGGTGDCTIVARLTGLTGPTTRLAGITVRDTSWKGAKRVNLVLDGNGTLQFRRRLTANTVDASSSTTGLSVPRWLKLERVGSTITASHASDSSGTPGTWTSVGQATVTMGANVSVGMVVSAGTSNNVSATASFDNVTVTPAVSGPALHSEDLGLYPIAGSSSEADGVITVNAVGGNDAAGSHFRYQQVWGDCSVTTRLTSHAGVTRGAQSGLAVRDLTDSGPFGFYGTTTIDGFQAHWRSSVGGAGGTLQTGGGIGNWIRLIRKGNTVNAFRAVSVNNAPGNWTQVTGNLPVAMGGPMLVGYFVDSASSTLTATGTFTGGLIVQPLNLAPIIDVGGPLPEVSPFNLNASVTDDGKPTPPGALSVQWSKLAGPGSVTFANPIAQSTLASLSMGGAYALRLTANDGDARVFDDLSFVGYKSSYERWQTQEFTGGVSNPLSVEDADPDSDRLNNLLEYALNTDAETSSGNPIVEDFITSGSNQYLRLTVPKNPAATDVTYTVEGTANLADPDSWTPTGLVIEQDTATLLRVRDSVPFTSTGRHFLRLRVRLP